VQTSTGRSASPLGTARDAWYACLPVVSSERQAAHASPVSHDRDSPARPAGRRCPVGARRLSIGVRVAREDVPGDTSGPRQHRLTIVSSHGPREHTADAVNPG
jgi:hypothetical protein